MCKKNIAIRKISLLKKYAKYAIIKTLENNFRRLRLKKGVALRLLYNGGI